MGYGLAILSVDKAEAEGAPEHTTPSKQPLPACQASKSHAA